VETTTSRCTVSDVVCGGNGVEQGAIQTCDTGACYATMFGGFGSDRLVAGNTEVGGRLTRLATAPVPLHSATCGRERHSRLANLAVCGREARLGDVSTTLDVAAGPGR
jgi:hypothetical protein